MDRYVDLIHLEPLVEIQKAFKEFNASLLDAGRNAGLDLEVTEVTVTYDGHAYAKVGYVDGEVLVEPLFTLVREIEDR